MGTMSEPCWCRETAAQDASAHLVDLLKAVPGHGCVRRSEAHEKTVAAGGMAPACVSAVHLHPVGGLVVLAVSG